MNHHLLIAGTGRAGTSFLVQYLTACGLETQLTLHPDVKLDQHANAGLEDLPIRGAHLPYVIKSPWLYEFVEDLVERDDITVDAVIMPMRDLVEASSSRVILEMRSRYGDDRSNDEVRRWETWGMTPGGMVYSLNPIDQARILALGFHETIFALVRKQIPIYFVDFSRMIQDGQYLWSALEPELRNTTHREGALAAHAMTADIQKVRVSHDLLDSGRIAEPTDGTSTPTANRIRYPELSALDRAAILKEMDFIRSDRRRLEAELAEAKDSAARYSSDRSALEADNQVLRGELALLREKSQEELSEITRLHAEEDRVRSDAYNELSRRIEHMTADHANQVRSLQTIISELKASNSWKPTRPLRNLCLMLQRRRG